MGVNANASDGMFFHFVSSNGRYAEVPPRGLGVLLAIHRRAHVKYDLDSFVVIRRHESLLGGHIS